MAKDTLTIGAIARQAGIATSTIRYYERIGVLPHASRESGQRRYGPDTVRKLQILATAKRAGFSLDEARVLLETDSGTAPASFAVRDLARAKLPDIEALIERAQGVRGWLLAATECDCDQLDACGLFDPTAQITASKWELTPLRLSHVPSQPTNA